MSMQDSIADMLTRIRNGLSARKKVVLMPISNQKKAIAALLLQEGYINNYEALCDDKGLLKINLKYYMGEPVIKVLKRISRPGLRIYKTFVNLPKVFSGYGVAVISTSKGIMSDRKARNQGIGGEIICYIA